MNKALWVIFLLGLAGSARGANCGNNTTPSGGYAGNNNYANAANVCTPAGNATVQSFGVYWYGSVSGNFSGAVYATSGAAPTGSPLCSFGSTPITSGNQTVSIAGCGTLTSGATYALAVNLSSSSNGLPYASSGAGTQDSYQAASFPNFPTGGTWSTVAVPHLTFYLVVTYGATAVVRNSHPARWRPW